MSVPFFSVVVPTCNRNDLLARCLERLAPGAQTFPAEQYEVIVSDDGADKPGRALVESQFSWVTYVEGPSRGPAANRNCGARRARGTWIAFTDDDCLPEPAWLEGYQAAILHDPADSLLEGRIYADRPRASLAEIAPVNETGGYLWSSNMALRRALFEEIGGFDERFRVAMEDVDMRYRLACAGHRATFVRSAAVCHPWREQTRSRDGWKRLSGYTEDTLRYIAFHPDEAKQLNTRYFLFSAVRGLLKNTLPGAIRFRGRGLRTAVSNHLTDLKLAWSVFTGVPSRLRGDANAYPE